MLRLLPALLFCAACGDGGADAPPDAPADSSTDCNPPTVLPSNYRLIAMTSTGLVNVTTASGVTSGTIDATAGGISASPDNPYIYVDLKNGVKVDVNDVESRTNTSWDIALKRSSLRTNGGDSGQGNRKVTVVAAASLADVTAAPSSGYGSDDFASADCMLQAIPGGEPLSAFGEWYDYNDTTHVVTPKPEVYVLERNNGSHTAFRVVTYYGDTTMATRGAFYKVEWKQL